MVVQHAGALVETTGVPGIGEPEPVEVQMVAELVAQRAQERPKGRDLLPHRCLHPYADQHARTDCSRRKVRSPGRPVFADSK